MYNVEYLNHFLPEKDYWWFKGQRIIVDNLIKKYKTKKKILYLMLVVEQVSILYIKKNMEK